VRKIVATIIVALVILSTAFAVTYAMTENLRKVILYDDGTWEYLDESEQGFLTDLPTKVVSATLAFDDSLSRTAHVFRINQRGI